MTFLALATKARSIRKHSSIASWLHGTAQRVAKKAKTAARRRLARESRVALAAEAAVTGDLEPSIEDYEFSPILHEEIERLPAKYRTPIVLCYLEGMTQEQAAVELGWPDGTVRGRLARARDLLRSRLTRRGLTLSAGLAASVSPADAASLGLSAALVEATVAAVLGRSAASGLSRTTALLLAAVIRDMAVARWTQLAAPLLLIALVACGTALFLYRGERSSPNSEHPSRRPGWSHCQCRPIWRANRFPTAHWPGSEPPASCMGRTCTTWHLFPHGTSLASFDGAVHFVGPLDGARTASHRDWHRPRRMAWSSSPMHPMAGLSPSRPERWATRPSQDEGSDHFDWTSLYDPRTGREIRRFEESGDQHGQTGRTALHSPRTAKCSRGASPAARGQASSSGTSPRASCSVRLPIHSRGRWRWRSRPTANSPDLMRHVDAR